MTSFARQVARRTQPKDKFVWCALCSTGILTGQNATRMAPGQWRCRDGRCHERVEAYEYETEATNYWLAEHHKAKA